MAHIFPDELTLCNDKFNWFVVEALLSFVMDILFEKCKNANSIVCHCYNIREIDYSAQFISMHIELSVCEPRFVKKNSLKKFLAKLTTRAHTDQSLIYHLRAR